MAKSPKKEQQLLKPLPTGDLNIVTTGRGVLIEGSKRDVQQYIDIISGELDTHGGRSISLALSDVAIGALLAKDVVRYQQYLEFSQLAVDHLEAVGLLPNMHSVGKFAIRHGKTLFHAKDVIATGAKIHPVAIAASVGVKLAIRDVRLAIEKVEGKIDKLTTLARSERLGSVLGDRSSLLPLVERARSQRRLSKTDWMTIAPLGPQMMRDMEALRSYIKNELDAVKDSKRTGSRSNSAKQLNDRLLRESFALLVVAEGNFLLWQELKLESARAFESDAVGEVEEETLQRLVDMNIADQELASLLEAVGHRLLTPTGFEGLSAGKKASLLHHVSELDEVGRWFCTQRNLDGYRSARPILPEFKESVDNVRTRFNELKANIPTSEDLQKLRDARRKGNDVKRNRQS